MLNDRSEGAAKGRVGIALIFFSCALAMMWWGGFPYICGMLAMSVCEDLSKWARAGIREMK